MCDLIDLKKEHQAVGVYDKGNQPDVMRMSIRAAPCLCGKRNFARLDNKSEWIEVERIHGTTVES